MSYSDSLSFEESWDKFEQKGFSKLVKYLNTGDTTIAFSAKESLELYT